MSKVHFSVTAIAVTPFTDYDFGAWIASTYPDSLAALAFSVIGSSGSIDLGVFSAPATTGVWQSVTARFNSGGNSVLGLSIVNRNTAFQGNDFGIDDITLNAAAAVPEPGSWAMLVVGFGLIGAMARRRPVGVRA